MSAILNFVSSLVWDHHISPTATGFLGTGAGLVKDVPCQLGEGVKLVLSINVCPHSGPSIWSTQSPAPASMSVVSGGQV